MTKLRYLAVPLVALALAGCTTPAGPVADPTPTPTPTATVEPVVAASLDIYGDRIDVTGGDGTVLNSYPFTGAPADVVAGLTDAIGAEPTVASSEAAKCSPGAQTVASWGNDALTIAYQTDGSTYWSLPDGVLFGVHAKAPAVGALAITAAGGSKVGEPDDAILAAYPGAQVVQWEDGADVHQVINFDVIAGTPDDANAPYWGARADALAGVVGDISSPVNYVADC